MKDDSNNLKSKIHWVCFPCGKSALEFPENKFKKQSSISTVHGGKCDVCGKLVPVTATRDFGYPIFEIIK